MYRINWAQHDGRYKAKASTSKQADNLIRYLKAVGAKKINVNLNTWV